VPASRIICRIFVALLALCTGACRDDAGYPGTWPALSSKSWVGGLGTGCPNLSGSFSLQDAALYQWLFAQKLERFRFAHQVSVLPSTQGKSVQFEFFPSTAGLQQIQQTAKTEGNLAEFPWRALARLEETDFRCEHGFLMLTRAQRFQIALSRSVEGDLVLRIDAPKDLRSVLRQSEGFALDDLHERHWIQFKRAEAAPETAVELTHVRLPRFALLETDVRLPRFALLETDVRLPRFALLETHVRLPSFALLGTDVASSEQAFAWNFSSENICVVRADSAPQSTSRKCEAPGKILSFTQKIEMNDPADEAGQLQWWYWPVSEPARARRLDRSNTSPP
jgi:hypothetical protein